MSPDVFWRRVERTHDCWIWQGARFDAGYGRVRADGRDQYAHRLAWAFSFGDIPEGTVIKHLCGRLDCVRPEHLVARPRTPQG